MSEWVLIYDGDCRFCQRSVDLVSKLDGKARIREVAFQDVELERYGVSRDAAEQAMQLVDPSGAVWSGAAAARELARVIPALRPFAWLFRIPGVMRLAERTYGWIARRRHRFGCESDVCRRGGSRQDRRVNSVR